MYHTFNFLTGYTQNNPTVQSIEWRLIVLESVAGVPGFVAAGKCSNSLTLLLLCCELHRLLPSPYFPTLLIVASLLLPTNTLDCCFPLITSERP